MKPHSNLTASPRANESADQILNEYFRDIAKASDLPTSLKIQDILYQFNKKVFSTIECADVTRLANTYHNALHRRTSEFEYPPSDVICQYLKEAIDCEVINGNIYFNGETTGLTEIELEIVEYLSDRSEITYPEIREYLLAQGFKEPSIVKNVFNSPFVHVDKTGDRKNYQFSLVGPCKGRMSGNATIPVGHDRYGEFRAQLENLEGTDVDSLQKARVEQRILSRWLFERKDREQCGICGGEFGVAALHTAHKKKRSVCTPDERRDPNIVMPMSVFGCDFLYEREHIVIENGKVKPGIPIDIDGPEKKAC